MFQLKVLIEFDIYIIVLSIFEMWQWLLVAIACI